jgi:hypothetical protein
VTALELAGLDEHGRRRWLDEHQPAAADRANWWLSLLVEADHEVRGNPAARPEWVELTLWLLAQARARAALADDEIAQRVAYFVLRMRRAGAEPASLPTPDAVVRACLDAVPARLDEVALLNDRRDLSGLDLPRMRHSRRAKILVAAAEGHLDQIEDEGTAAELRAWIEVKPRLV